MEKRGPDYIKIFSDIILKKFPEKASTCKHFLEKEKLSSLDVITLNRILFNDCSIKNGHKSYDHESIIQILEHQKKNKMTDTEIATLFRLSRNTLSGWKKTIVTRLEKDKY
ncbi:helix-turn-helix domain-containing protein [Chryseobacterium kwangjuense]|uniref:Helix-turn-helix domain-containing protein n=1 Tax=Chryseobacterium kwangjuense TaxID=267125 RepID=A0ABW9K9D2_9FLAO